MVLAALWLTGAYVLFALVYGPFLLHPQSRRVTDRKPKSCALSEPTVLKIKTRLR
jgi:hypothetical protein